MHRTVCVELLLHNLTVNTILESKYVHTLEGVDLTKDLVRSAATGDATAAAAAAAALGHGGGGTPDDSVTAVSSGFRILKLMVQD